VVGVCGGAVGCSLGCQGAARRLCRTPVSVVGGSPSTGHPRGIHGAAPAGCTPPSPVPCARAIYESAITRPSAGGCSRDGGCVLYSVLARGRPYLLAVGGDGSSPTTPGESVGRSSQPGTRAQSVLVLFEARFWMLACLDGLQRRNALPCRRAPHATEHGIRDRDSRSDPPGPLRDRAVPFQAPSPGRARGDQDEGPLRCGQIAGR
jgi:hypothetical protein